MTETRSPSEVVAGRLRALRRSYGWSVRELAERCAEIGLPLTENALENIERGRTGVARRGRDITVDELLRLAQVFDVPPLALLVPLGEDIEVAVAPGIEAKPYALWAWLVGDTGGRIIGNRPDTPARMAKWSKAAQPIQRHRDLSHAHRELGKAEQAAATARRVGDQDGIRSAEARYTSALTVWVKALQAMADDGMMPPAYPPKWADDARNLGLLDVGVDDGQR